MAKSKKLSDSEVLSILDSHRRQSLGDESSELATDRASAMDHYHGRPYGNEQDGRSQVVSKDLADTVGWIMPTIMKAFTQTGNLVDFVPTGEEDEEQAELEADYTNHVIMKDNDGWLMLHDWVKDSILLKNGYVKHWWDESETIREAEYSGLTEIGLAQLFQELEQEGAKVEVLEQESEIVQTDQGPMEVFEVCLKITSKKGRVRIEALPAEEVRISKRARKGTQTSPFTEHFTTKPRTELIEMGMDADWVNELPAKNSDDRNDVQKSARDSIIDESNQTDQTSDRSMDEIEYCEAYVKMDYDKDGKAELRKIITAGGKIPPGKEWNEAIDCVAITSMVTKRVPHRHVGESLDDDLADLQKIKTFLTRQFIDNIASTNNQEYVINELANIPDFLQSLPGGLKRIKTDQPVMGMVMPLPTTPIINQILPAIDYIDTMKDDRTGVNKLSTNVDPDVLKNTTKGAFMEGVSRASQKVEMILRMCAETGVKELALRVHELLIKHQDIPRKLKLSGKYAEVNPTEWRERTDMTVKVGLGTGTEEEKREKLSLVANLQLQLKEMGLIGPKQGYKLFDDMLSTMNIENAEKYAMNPEGDEYKQLQKQLANQPPPINPLAEVEQIKGQFNLQQEQLRAHVKVALDESMAAQKMQIEELRIRMDAANSEADRISRETIESAKLEIQAMLAGLKEDLGKPGIGAGLQEPAKVFDPVTGTFI
jgi:hypothetical protein